MHLAPPNPSGSRFPTGVLGWRVGVTATGNALELPSFLAQHHVPWRALVAAGGKKLALPTFAGRDRGCRDTTMAYLDFSFSVASGRHYFLSFCCPLEGDLSSNRSFFLLLLLLPTLFSLLSFPSSGAPRCIWSLTPNKDGTPGWREVPSCYLHACARLSPLEVPSGEGGAVAGVNAPQNLCLPFSGTPTHPCPSSHLSFPNSGLFQGPVRPLGQFGGGRQKTAHPTPFIRGGGAR